MSACRFGDIVLVPFPFTNQTATKQRPAVVISSDAYHRERPDLIIMAVTSQIRPSTTVGDVFVQDWQTAGLIKSSAIKPVITTIEPRLVRKQLGTLSSADQKRLREAIGQIIG
jgi:mRNA interferase MazF